MWGCNFTVHKSCHQFRVSLPWPIFDFLSPLSATALVSLSALVVLRSEISDPYFSISVSPSSKLLADLLGCVISVERHSGFQSNSGIGVRTFKAAYLPRPCPVAGSVLGSVACFCWSVKVARTVNPWKLM